jgi:hypothetical protein
MKIADELEEPAEAKARAKKGGKSQFEETKGS